MPKNLKASGISDFNILLKGVTASLREFGQKSDSLVRTEKNLPTAVQQADFNAQPASLEKKFEFINNMVKSMDQKLDIIHMQMSKGDPNTSMAAHTETLAQPPATPLHISLSNSLDSLSSSGLI